MSPYIISHIPRIKATMDNYDLLLHVSCTQKMLILEKACHSRL